jgi:adenine-specific DNA glycosylase
MKILSKEAEKMKENVYKYLESLSNLGKNFCMKDDPKCIKCPMNKGCQYRMSQANEKKGFFRR